MELRKNPELDLERKRGMFFSIGLFVSLSFVLTAFQWKTEITNAPWEEPIDNEIFTYVMEPIATVHKIPERPKPIKKVVNPIYLEAKVDQFIAETEVEEAPVEEPDFSEMALPEIPIEIAPTVFNIVEEMPEPVGGMPAFYEFLSKNMKYPNMARRMDVQGKVYVQFIIDKDGSITDIEVIKGIKAGCDEEAIRILSKAPKWNPGKQRGKPVKVKMVVPVFFQLSS